jgi:UDP-N-acetylglucosamine--N-acetylmuramyl-(pentapeptide) pyrophosphoryl-undecaprenol N-acetylglucosamine transferase
MERAAIVQVRRTTKGFFVKTIILLTGGGSAGHVTPNLALAQALFERGYDVHYAGRTEGIEKDLIAPTGLPYHGLSAGKFRRYMSLENLTDIARIAKGSVDAWRIVRRVQPTLVFSKGGFVSCPVVWAAWLHRIPVVVHESDVSPGLANKLSIPFASRICYAFPETGQYFDASKRVHTGIPVRSSLLGGDAEQGRRICGFQDVAKPTLLIMGGSLGSRIINDTVQAALPDLLSHFNVCHLLGPTPATISAATPPGYFTLPYAGEELAHLLALASLVLSRAGATTLFELLASRKPHLLIPLSLRASRGDQIQNASCFERLGFSDVLPEEALTPETLCVALCATYAKRQQFVKQMAETPIANATERVVETIESCLSGS